MRFGSTSQLKPVDLFQDLTLPLYFCLRPVSPEDPNVAARASVADNSYAVNIGKLSTFSAGNFEVNEGNRQLLGVIAVMNEPLTEDHLQACFQGNEFGSISVSIIGRASKRHGDLKTGIGMFRIPGNLESMPAIFEFYYSGSTKGGHALQAISPSQADRRIIPETPERYSSNSDENATPQGRNAQPGSPAVQKNSGRHDHHRAARRRCFELALLTQVHALRILLAPVGDGGQRYIDTMPIAEFHQLFFRFEAQGLQLARVCAEDCIFSDQHKALLNVRHQFQEVFRMQYHERCQNELRDYQTRHAASIGGITTAAMAQGPGDITPEQVLEAQNYLNNVKERLPLPKTQEPVPVSQVVPAPSAAAAAPEEGAGPALLQVQGDQSDIALDIIAQGEHSPFMQGQKREARRSSERQASAERLSVLMDGAGFGDGAEIAGEQLPDPLTQQEVIEHCGLVPDQVERVRQASRILSVKDFERRAQQVVQDLAGQEVNDGKLALIDGFLRELPAVVSPLNCPAMDAIRNQWQDLQRSTRLDILRAGAPQLRHSENYFNGNDLVRGAEEHARQNLTAIKSYLAGFNNDFNDFIGTSQNAEFDGLRQEWVGKRDAAQRALSHHAFADIQRQATSVDLQDENYQLLDDDGHPLVPNVIAEVVTRATANLEAINGFLQMLNSVEDTSLTNYQPFLDLKVQWEAKRDAAQIAIIQAANLSFSQSTNENVLRNHLSIFHRVEKVAEAVAINSRPFGSKAEWMARAANKKAPNWNLFRQAVSGLNDDVAVEKRFRNGEEGGYEDADRMPRIIAFHNWLALLSDESHSMSSLRSVGSNIRLGSNDSVNYNESQSVWANANWTAADTLFSRRWSGQRSSTRHFVAEIFNNNEIDGGELDAQVRQQQGAERMAKRVELLGQFGVYEDSVSNLSADVQAALNEHFPHMESVDAAVQMAQRLSASSQ